MATVYMEAGQKKTFAMALDWPGWGRSGRDAGQALENLAAYADRYAVVAKAAGVAFKPGELTVVETLPGSATTDFGAPEAIAGDDTTPLTAAQAKRLAKLVAAAWTIFDQVAAVSPEELRKGPRGGGRDRDKMIAHVLDAENAYSRKLGVKGSREDLLAVIGKASDGTPPKPGGWPVRYAARRIAWHVLDHAWEMEDRAS